MIGRLLDRPWIVLATALIVQAALFVAVQRDLATADPLFYANYAHDLAFRTSDLFATHDLHPFKMRLGVTVPIAVLYRWLGVSTLTTNLLCLLAGLGIVVIAYAAATTPRAKLLAVAFASVCTPLLLDGRELTPDLPSAAVMAASILCLARRDRPRGAWWLVGAAVLWFAAFQIKETAVWCAPSWIYAVVCDLRRRGAAQVARSYAPAVGVGAVLAAGYLVFCAIVWGSPLARFTGIEDAAEIHTWSLVGHPTRDWVARLIWEVPELVYRMFRWELVPVVLSPWLVRGRDRIWIVATLTIILMYWFGSSTLAVYMPLPSHRRMLLPALPGIIVLAALSSDAALDRIRDLRWRLALGVAFVVCLVVPQVSSLRKRFRPDRPELAAYAALRAEVASTTDRIVLVCGEPRCPMFTSFYFGYEIPANLTVIHAPDFAANPLPQHARVRLIANVVRADAVGNEAARRAEALGLPRILWHPELRLYNAGDGARLHKALASAPLP